MLIILIYSGSTILHTVMLTVACIPAYNEERTIADIVKRSLSQVDKVIVCDDGSKDNTSTKAKEAGATVIRHEKNLGKGAALKTLFKHAREINSDIMVTIDGDGQFLPEEIEALIKPIVENNMDVVIGYRFDEHNEMPAYRKAGNKMLDKITSMASELPFRDTQSGFRAYSKKAINSIRFLTDGFGVDSEILVDASKKGLQISEVKVTVLYDTGGKTSTKNPVSHTGGVVASLVELVALRHPLKYLAIPGLILIITVGGFGVHVMSLFNETRYFSMPFTLIALGTLVIGVILMLMAVVLFSVVLTSKRR